MTTETYSIWYKQRPNIRVQKYHDPITGIDYYEDLEECIERVRILLKSFNTVQIIRNK